MKLPYTTYFAAGTYDCDTYGSGAYNESDCTTTSPATSSGATADSPLGPLTGVGPILLNPYFIVGALVVIIAVTSAFLLRRKRS